MALSRVGAKVAAGARRIDRLESLQSEISKNGGEIFIQKLDVTVKSECDAFADAVIKKWDTIDILVNNAGLQPLSFFKNLKVDEWDKMIDVNIKAALRLVRLTVPGMIDRGGGAVINVASVAATIAFPAIAAYSATKSAVDRLTRVAAMEAGKLGYGVRVNCIYPGLVPTEMGMKLAGDVVAELQSVLAAL
jgi:NADP-dependent 3-hydroxy acid dehydrogenase YdfG